MSRVLWVLLDVVEICDDCEDKENSSGCKSCGGTGEYFDKMRFKLVPSEDAVGDLVLIPYPGELE